ncbi:hypothetical protein HQN90_21065 [Paenibacillus alba]|nr:hypothetical protein [Paenibacillus alba]
MRLADTLRVRAAVCAGSGLLLTAIQPASRVETAFLAGSAPAGCFSPAETAFSAGSACFYRDSACFSGRDCLFGWLSAGWMLFSC